MLVTVRSIQVLSHEYLMSLRQDEIAALANRLNNPCQQLHPIDEAYVQSICSAINNAMASVEPEQQN